jgi:hypothetical protein
LALLLVAFIPPANLLSLIYIFFFQAFLYLIYLYGSGDRVVTRLVKYIGLMILVSIIIIMIRYMYTIAIINFAVQLLFQESDFLSDMGLDPNLNTLKLIGNGLVL